MSSILGRPTRTTWWAMISSLLTVVLVATGPLPASADDPAPLPTLTLTAAASDVPLGTPPRLVLTVAGPGGVPVPGQDVTLTQTRPDGSVRTHPGATDDAGRTAWEVPGGPGAHRFVARTPGGAASGPVQVTVHRETASVTITAKRPGLMATHGRVRVQVSRTAYGGESRPWAGAAVTWQRREGGRWVAAGRGTTGPQGVLGVRAAPGRVRAVVAGTSEVSGARAAVRVRKPPRLKVRVKAPGRARAERRVRVRVRIGRAGKRRVRVVLRAHEGRGWRTIRRRSVKKKTNVAFRHRPSTSTRYRARVRVRGNQRTRTFGSPVHRLRATPAVAPFRAPRGAPEPRIKLPAQPPPVGAGPNPVITRIGNATWRSMVGRSWHRGCPVGRAGLRLLRINYYGYDGFRHRGELVAHRGAVRKMARGLSRLHAHRVQIRSMYRVDRFGWSKRLGGADDYKSMAAGNTSAFNCRHVVGRPGRRSPHSGGRALDLNPWENPYYSPQDGWLPNRWYRDHTVGVHTWRSHDHLVVRLMRSAGMRWTYGVQDSHHFDG